MDQILDLFKNVTVLAIGFGICLVLAIITIFPTIGKWRVYTKAGFPGWAMFIPFYGEYCLVRIAGFPTWVYLLKLGLSFLVPQSDKVANIMVNFMVGRAYGKGAGFNLGLSFIPIVFYTILGWDQSTHLKPSYLNYQLPPEVNARIKKALGPAAPAAQEPAAQKPAVQAPAALEAYQPQVSEPTSTQKRSDHHQQAG